MPDLAGRHGLFGVRAHGDFCGNTCGSLVDHEHEFRLALLREHRIDVVVSKDSGGTATAAKLVAARALRLPVVLVDRPPTGPATTVPTVEAAADWLATRLAACGL
jgi:precorrin-6x reductase